MIQVTRAEVCAVSSITVTHGGGGGSEHGSGSAPAFSARYADAGRP